MADDSVKPARSSVLRLRGLPYQATEDDIRGFFTGFVPVVIHTCKRNGRATGEAYVQFGSETEAARAIAAKNSQYLGHRYIEIFEALEGDIGIKTALGGSDLKLKGFVVRMRGLPFTTTAEQVVEFFEGVQVVRGAEGVVFTRLPDGRPTGEAYVEFPTKEEQDEAMKRHKEKLGSRYIELFVSSKGDMLQAVQHNGYYTGQPDPQHAKQQRHGGGSHAGPGQHAPSFSSDGSTLELRGLPYSATIDDITTFFAGFNIGEKDVHLTSRVDSRSGQVTNTGYAYVQFGSSADAERAREVKHCAMMGSRYVECLAYPHREGGRHRGGDDDQRSGGSGSQGHTPKANGRVHPKGMGAPHMSPQGQPLMGPPDYSAQQQQQMLMQQHYHLMHQHLALQQQQAVHGYDQVPWSSMGGGVVGAPGPATPRGVGPPGWYKGFSNAPGMGPPAMGHLGSFPAAAAAGYGYGMGPSGGGGSGPIGGGTAGYGGPRADGPFEFGMQTGHGPSPRGSNSAPHQGGTNLGGTAHRAPPGGGAGAPGM